MQEEISNLQVTSKCSDDGVFRYSLEKIWENNKPKALFILINPSKGTSLKLDNTICNIVNYCVDGNYGAMRLVNLFPLMATSPQELSGKLKCGQQDNNIAIIESINWATNIYIAWGSNDKYQIKRKREVENILYEHCSGKQIRCWMDSKNNYPKHLRIMSDSWVLLDYNYKFIECT